MRLSQKYFHLKSNAVYNSSAKNSGKWKIYCKNEGKIEEFCQSGKVGTMTWFIKKSKQFNQSDTARDIAALMLMLSVNGPVVLL